jgi:hypothetical protein
MILLEKINVRKFKIHKTKKIYIVSQNRLQKKNSDKKELMVTV